MKEIKQFELLEQDLAKESFPKEGIFIPESDYGLANIYLNEQGDYILEEIPTFGGRPFIHIFNQPKDLILELKSWT